LNQRFWTPEEKMEVIKRLTVDDLRTFIPIFLSSMKIRGLVQGNITKEESLQLVEMMEGTLHKTKPLFPSQYPEQRLVKFKKGLTYVHQSSVPNQHDINSVIWLEYQISARSVRADALVELLGQIFQVPFYEQLRTQEQLGYLVWSFYHYDEPMALFTFCVQSPQKDPKFLNERIDAFLTEFEENLVNMSDEEFKTQVEAVITVKLQKFQNLGEEVASNWEEVFNQTCQFNRRFVVADELRKITKEELVQFYREKMLKENTRRRYSLRIYGINSPLVPEEASSSMVIIHDGKESEFKSSMPFYPSRSFAQL